MILILISFLSSLYAADISFELMHTKPVCEHLEKTCDASTGLCVGPAKSKAWCTLDDKKNIAETSGMEKKINEMLDRAQDPLTARISIAYFSFSNKAVAKKLCEKVKQKIKIEFFLDADYRGSELVNQLNSCLPDPQDKHLRFHFLGRKAFDEGVWRLHHNKFMIVEPGDGSYATISFSSGNLSAFGTSLHFDHWVNAQTDQNTYFYKMHTCVVDSLIKAIDVNGDGQDDDVDDPNVYRQNLDNCLAVSVGEKKYYEILQTEKVAPFFSPNPQNEIAKALISEIKRVKSGESIKGAMQHFLHKRIADTLKASCQRGVKVDILMDDDVLTGQSEVPGVNEFYEQNLKNSCINIRFMETNAEIRQMMHNKYLILGNKRVFAGAGHFTYAGMRDNYENFYLLEDVSIHEQYEKLFQFMFEMSLTAEQILVNQAGSSEVEN